MGAGAQAMQMDSITMQEECNTKIASFLGPPGSKASIGFQISSRSADELLASNETPDSTPSTSLSTPSTSISFMLEENIDCERCPDHAQFQNTARHILRSLGRGWVTPDHSSSWTSLGKPDSEKIRSILPKLNRGWMTPDAPACGPVDAQSLETALLESMMTSRQNFLDVKAEDKLSGCFAKQIDHTKLGDMTADGSASPGNASGHSAATSSANWHTPAETLIILDWDDTLLPSSWLRNLGSAGRCRSQLQASDLAELDRLDQVARSLVIAASTLGHICCITLSKRPWQATTMQQYMPRLAEVWKELDIQVVYAEESIDAPHRFASHPVKKVEPDEKEATQILNVKRTLAKKRAMEKYMNKFYDNCSWKNVVSIGDGDAEWDALREINFCHVNPCSSKTQSPKSMRTKAIKLLDMPDCSALRVELEVLQAWLPGIVSYDEDVFFSMTDDEEDILALHQRFFEQ